MIAPILQPPIALKEIRMVDAATPSDRKVIGQAAMLEDGTIVLDLRMEDPKSGAIGDARLRYRKGEPDYQPTLDHLGGLKPGEIKPIYNDWK
jgi:hypothetical protein